jgi:p-methyltransferase
MWYCEPGTPIFHQKDKYQIKGNGFVWTHATMDSLEAMDHIDRMFLSVDESIWLPQWSFDFWIIPYLIGKGISPARFKEFMEYAHKLLALEIASVPEDQKARLQQQHLKKVIEQVGKWSLPALASAA